MEEVKLVPSEGVGSGGAGHQTHSSVFRLPPPIPGIIGGGYPSEWHDAATRIQTSFRGHNARRKIKMEDVTLVESPAEAEEGQRVRKRDMIMKLASNPLKYVKDVATKVAQNETVKSQVDKLSQATSNITKQTTDLVGQAKDRIGAVLKKEQAEGGEAGGAGAQKDDRRGKYAGWILETVKTKGKAVFYLARRGAGSAEEAPFDVARKEAGVEVIEISARTDLKTTFNVQVGDTLKWTFAVKSHDVAFKVMMRKMMDVGGSDDEELVPSMKVDSTSVGEGTYTVQESGTVVLFWDNGYSMMRSKTVAYRAWVERAGAAETAPPPAASVAAAAALPAAVTPNEGATDDEKTREEQAKKIKQQEEADRAKLDKIAAEKRKEEEDRVAAETAAKEARELKEKEAAAAAAEAEKKQKDEQAARERVEAAQKKAAEKKQKEAEEKKQKEEEEKKQKEAEEKVKEEADDKAKEEE